MIDRNPKAFAAILSYLRTRRVFPSYEGVTIMEVACEAEYFGLSELSDELSLSGLSCHEYKEVLRVGEYLRYSIYRYRRYRRYSPSCICICILDIFSAKWYLYLSI